MIDWVKRLIKKNKFFYYGICVAYYVYGGLTAALFMVMRIFPIKKNKIVCCGTKGKRYGDSPKYLADEIIRQGLNYEIVWLMRDGYEADFPKEIRRAKYNFFSCAYELVTAKFWIDTNTKQFGTLKRKNQYYIQTWHGTALKKLDGDIPDKINFFDRLITKYNSKIYDVMLSDSNYLTEIYRSALWYKGEVLECGSPRNDIFFDNRVEYARKVKKFFHLDKQKIVLYAPTFRDDFRLEEFRLDFERLIGSLKRRFDGEWVVLVRLHPNNIADAEQFIKYTDKIINATIYNDIQELLVACDVLVTDYSSCMFDFMMKKAPCFLYATDIQKYREERDFYIDLYELPFPLAKSNEEMEHVILQFDGQKYDEDVQLLFERLGTYQKGTACKQVLTWMTHCK